MTYLILFFLVLLSGCFSGLTLGFFSLNLSSLERKINLGDARAISIYPIRKRGNLLLCTLLLGNVAVNSAMAIILGDLASGFIAGIVSTGLIVIFGEILPQAVFSRYALSLGSKTVWLVRFFIFIFYPIAYPISWVLDKVLGDEMATIWDKKEIEEIIKHHEKSDKSEIDEDEQRILLGALTFSEKKVIDVLTPKSIVYWLKKNDVVSEPLIEEIKQNGHSRIPVFENTKSEKLFGILRSSQLLGLKGDENKNLEQLVDTDTANQFVSEQMKLDDLLNVFLRDKTHLSIVYNQFGVFLGVITLEDILEEILSIEILDEKDTKYDLRQFAMLEFINSLSKKQDKTK